MTVRTDPEALGGLASDLRASTDRLGATKPAAESPQQSLRVLLIKAFSTYGET